MNVIKFILRALLFIILFAGIGSFLERTETITDPAWFALYGAASVFLYQLVTGVIDSRSED